MREAERRALVFTNLVNGQTVETVREAFHLSEADVLADFEFVVAKVRSYRFERLMPILPCSSIAEARAHRVEMLVTLPHLNLDKPAKYSKIVTLPYTVNHGGGMSEAEMRMLEWRARAQGRRP